MSYEVDVLAVGKESKSGDAIALRYGDFRYRHAYKVVVIDGGFEANGHELVEVVKGTYNTDRVDIVISTHPDADHLCGLNVVLEELQVGRLWMHLPWNHVGLLETFSYRGHTKEFPEQLEKSLEGASELESLARKKRVVIEEPFTGLASEDKRIRILGPAEAYYRELLGLFKVQPSEGLFATLLEALREKAREFWAVEALAEPAPDATRPQNNSSVVSLALLDSDAFLFTADAGVPALERAIPPQYLELFREWTKFVQLPHHGSKRNIGPSLLDRMLGPKQAKEAPHSGITAFISAAADGAPKHPSRRVVNAGVRRKAKVVATQGESHYYRSNDLPPRPGYSALTPLEFLEDYEE